MTTVASLDVFRVPLGGVQLIEASAGTGKTWAICGLVLRLLLERDLSVQQLLVVTFTNAATAELRQRIRQPPGRQSVAGSSAGGRRHQFAEGDPFVRGLLASLRVSPAMTTSRCASAWRCRDWQTFDEASIFTIHGFCQRALGQITPIAAQPAVPPGAGARRQRPAGLQVACTISGARDVGGAAADPEALATRAAGCHRDSP